MAKGLNKVTLIGNLGVDPEVNNFENAKNVRFSVATNEVYKNKNGEIITHTEWHRVVLWRGLADVAEQYLRKGDQVYIEGRIRTSTYEKDGETKYFTEIQGDSLIMLSKREETTDIKKQTDRNVSSGDEPIENILQNDKEDDLPF